MPVNTVLVAFCRVSGGSAKLVLIATCRDDGLLGLDGYTRVNTISGSVRLGRELRTASWADWGWCCGLGGEGRDTYREGRYGFWRFRFEVFFRLRLRIFSASVLLPVYL